MKANLATILALVLLVVACSGPGNPDVTPSSSPTPTATAALQSTPTPTLQGTHSPTPTALATPTATPVAIPTPAVDRSIPPDRDLFALAQRLVLKSMEPIPRVVNPQPVSYTEGREDQFNVLDLLARRMYPVTATLQVVSDHAYWYVDDSIELSTDDLMRAAEAYETEIHPLITRSFGDMWGPEDGEDRRLTILHTPLAGVRGYYSSLNELPAEVQPKSNERKMIFMDGGRLNPGSSAYLGTLTHEVQHAIHRIYRKAQHLQSAHPQDWHWNVQDPHGNCAFPTVEPDICHSRPNNDLSSVCCDHPRVYCWLDT